MSTTIVGKTDLLAAIHSSINFCDDLTDWSDRAMSDVRSLTAQMGLHWDFTSWSDLLSLIEADRPVNGYLLVDADVDAVADRPCSDNETAVVFWTPAGRSFRLVGQYLPMSSVPEAIVPFSGRTICYLGSATQMSASDPFDADIPRADWPRETLAEFCGRLRTVAREIPAIERDFFARCPHST